MRAFFLRTGSRTVWKSPQHQRRIAALRSPMGEMVAFLFRQCPEVLGGVSPLRFSKGTPSFPIHFAAPPANALTRRQKKPRVRRAFRLSQGAGRHLTSRPAAGRAYIR